jgi:hypothetical protein
MVEWGVLKRALRIGIKVLGYLAGFVALLVPITMGDGSLVFLVACLIGVGCVLLYTWLDEGPGSTTLFPRDKNLD